MSVQQMQQQLINQISNINNEDILRMLGEELDYSLQSQTDLSSLLNEEDLNELKALANEPIDKNTMSLDEFNNIMEQWRMK
ncbi:MAG: hypothetical protein K0Q79_1115 [Flavipsychrobacter sp.]|jgi:hypothetical protein|nr:hypothetical protein [Flavipsychrobacter sp.]